MALNNFGILLAGEGEQSLAETMFKHALHNSLENKRSDINNNLETLKYGSTALNDYVWFNPVHLNYNISTMTLNGSYIKT